MKKFDKFFQVKTIHIVFLSLCFMLGFLVGFFGEPQKQCGQVYCVADEQYASRTYNSSIANAIVSQEHLDELASRVAIEGIDAETLRKSISLDLKSTGLKFTVSFSCKNSYTASKIVTVFCEYSIGYINSKIGSLKNTLAVDHINYYKINEPKYALASGFLSAFSFITIVYLPLQTNINLDKSKEGMHV